MSAIQTNYDPQSLRARLRFARVFLKNPVMIGAVLPSSRRLTCHLLDELDWRSARVIVEYGPGVGTMTWEILQRMRPDAVLVAIECNPDLVAHLRANFEDERMRIVQGSAADVCGILAGLDIQQADAIVTSIPLTTLSKADRERILRESHRALRHNGMLAMWQYTTAVLPHLQNVFQNVRQDFELMNILPARLYYCMRNGAGGD
jgi:phospholipid N-methyltransferase